MTLPLPQNRRKRSSSQIDCKNLETTFNEALTARKKRAVNQEKIKIFLKAYIEDSVKMKKQL